VNRKRGGFTLIEVLATCTMVGVITAVAVPVYTSARVKARRTDAVAALMRVQSAQERLREGGGAYTDDLRALGVAGASMEGLYALEIDLAGRDSYLAVATPLPGSSQTADRECPRLLLEVTSGFAQMGPSARCWNR